MRRQSPSIRALQALLGRFGRFLPLRWRTLAIRVLAQAWGSRALRRHHRALIILGPAFVLLALASLVRPVRFEGDLQGLLPAEHRAQSHLTYVLLEVEPGREPLGDPAARLVEGAGLIADASGGAWVPLAAPPVELEGWLAQHALDLVPRAQHDAVLERFAPTSVEHAVTSMKSAMASPFFVLRRDDVMRDPLGLRQIHEPLAPSHHHVWLRSAGPTDRGDLLARQGDALLLALRTEGRPPELIATLPALVEPLGLQATVVGPARQLSLERSWLAALFEQLAMIVLASWTVVVVLWQRRLASSVHLVVLLALLGCAGLLLCSPVQPLDVPLIIAALSLGVACTMQGRDRRVLVWLGAAMLPLLLTPYPLWQTWAWRWPLLAGASALCSSYVVAPHATSTTQVAQLCASWLRRTCALRLSTVRRLQGVAFVVMAGSAIFAWSHHTTAPEVAFAPADPLQRKLTQTFFDPDHIAWHETRAASLPEALELATQQVSETAWGDGLVVRSPAHILAGYDAIEQRRAALQARELTTKLEAVAQRLTAHGFREDAFGEFLHGYAQSEGPLPTVALQSALSPWIASFSQTRDDRVSLRTLVHVRDRQAAAAHLEATPDLPLHGPIIAAAHDAKRLGLWLLAALGGQLAIALLLLATGPRRLLACMRVGALLCSAYGIGISVLVFAGLPLGPHLLPALLAGASLAASPFFVVYQDRPASQRPGFAALALGVAASLALLIPETPLWAAFATAQLAALGGGTLAAWLCVIRSQTRSS